MKQTFAIRHEIPGRLRLRLPELKRRKDAVGPEALKPLTQHEGVLLVRSNPQCASLVLRYDPDILPRKQTLGLVAEHFPSARPRQAEGICSLSPGCECHAGAPGSVKREFKRFAAISAVVGVTFVRTTLFGGAVTQTLLTPLGILTLALSLPLARRGLQRLQVASP